MILEISTPRPPNTSEGMHNRILSNHPSAGRLRHKPRKKFDKIVHTPLNPRRRPLGRRSHERQFPVRHTTERRDLGQPTIRRRSSEDEPANRLIDQPRSHAPRDAPEPDSQ
jgi:hypothetical protein